MDVSALVKAHRRAGDEWPSRRREAYNDAFVVAVLVHGSFLLCTSALGHKPLVLAACLLVTGLGLGMGATTVLHHAGHKRFSNNTYANALVVHLAAPAGLWVWHWGMKHRIHHRVPALYPDDGYTSATRVVRLHAAAPWAGPHRLQAFYISFLYAFYGLIDLMSQCRYMWNGKNAGELVVSFSRPDRVRRFLAEKAMVAPVIATYVFIGSERFVVFFVAATMLGSLFAAVLVGVGHINVGVAADREDECVGPDAWTDHVLAATLSFSPNSRFQGWFTGGLNLHAAHHLLPTATRAQLRALHDELRLGGAPIKESPGLTAAIRGHYRTLHEWGQYPAAASFAHSNADHQAECARADQETKAPSCSARRDFADARVPSWLLGPQAGAAEVVVAPLRRSKLAARARLDASNTHTHVEVGRLPAMSESARDVAIARQPTEGTRG